MNLKVVLGAGLIFLLVFLFGCSQIGNQTGKVGLSTQEKLPQVEFVSIEWIGLDIYSPTDNPKDSYVGGNAEFEFNILDEIEYSLDIYLVQKKYANPSEQSTIGVAYCHSKGKCILSARGISLTGSKVLHEYCIHKYGFEDKCEEIRLGKPKVDVGIEPSFIDLKLKLKPIEIRGLVNPQTAHTTYEKFTDKQSIRITNKSDFPIRLSASFYESELFNPEEGYILRPPVHLDGYYYELDPNESEIVVVSTNILTGDAWQYFGTPAKYIVRLTFVIGDNRIEPDAQNIFYKTEIPVNIIIE